MGKNSFRTRIILALYIISFAVSIFIFSVLMRSVAIHIEYNSYRQCAVTGKKVYFTHNQNGQNYIFAINKNAKVEEMYRLSTPTDSRILGISALNEDVFVVEQADTGYRILQLDETLQMVSRTSTFEIDEGYIFSGFSAEETGLYLTLLSEEGSIAKVISVDLSNLKELSETSDDDVKTEVIGSIKTEEKRFFADALYAKGQLFTRFDNSEPIGVFEKDPKICDLISDMDLGISQILSIYAAYLIRYVSALIVWFIILYLLVKMFENRNRSFYYLCIEEAVLFVIVGAATLAVARGYQSSRELEHSRFAVASMQGLMEEAGLNEYVDYSNISFYNTERYQEIRKALSEFVKRKGNSRIFYDVMIVRLKDNLVCAGATGRNRSALSDNYGSELIDLFDGLYKGQNYAIRDFTLDGQPYRAVAIADKELAPNYALVGIIGTSSNDNSVIADNLGVFKFFLATFAVASAAVILVGIFRMKDLIVMEQALKDTALGNSIKKRPRTLGTDIKDMWDAVSEIHKRVENLQYSKLKIMEAYYRFAPKNIELILGKNSILEVRNGDSRTFDGTIGFMKIHTDYKNRQKRLDSVISAIGEYATQNEAMIIGKDVDISNLQMVISDQQTDIIKSLVEIFKNHAEEMDNKLTTMFLYRTKFTFCIVGNDSESSLSLSYDYYNDKELLSDIVTFLDAMDMGMVVSKWVQERDGYDGSLRFIGYGGEVENGIEIALYEVLDACDEKQRSEKLATLDRFNKALKLYHDKDFYLARNMFSEILKETPTDKLVRWYVFESERDLHEGAADGNGYKYVHL